MSTPLDLPPPDPATSAALDDVVASRQALADELVRLEASARAAVDIRAKVRRNPGKTAAAVGGRRSSSSWPATGLPVGEAPGLRCPGPVAPSLLPDQVEKAVQASAMTGRRSGRPGARVRRLRGRGVRAEKPVPPPAPLRDRRAVRVDGGSRDHQARDGDLE